MTKNTTTDLNFILVTGANGFLGSEIIHQTNQIGLQVRATDQQDRSRHPEIDYFQADILNPSSLVFTMDGVESVIHAAGLAHVFDKTKAAVAAFKAINEIGTANVARVAAEAGAKHLVLISSVSVYGGISSSNDEDTACWPEGPYAESKWQAEQRATEIAQATGLNLTILRLATLYGEGDPGNVARLMRTIDRGRFVWVGNGSNYKSLIHREDAARACIAALQAAQPGINIYNVSTPPCTMREVVAGLAAALGRRLPRWHIPASLALGLTRRMHGSGWPASLSATIEKWLADDVYDARKFERTFNFQTQVSLVEGLRREVAWYREIEQSR